jgi:uncharacterized protein (TIGR00661 family)
MPTFCFYVSDYGSGHATRSIALIRRILSRIPDSHIVVKSDGPYDLLAGSLHDPRVSVIRCRNDITVPLHPATEMVDSNRTCDLVHAWIESWNSYITHELQFCKDHSVDLILSDIAPQPFLVASDLGIPSIAVSNFSWDSIFSPFFPDGSEDIRCIRSAYTRATRACILPFNIPMDAFPRKTHVNLLAREITTPRDAMREQLGLSKDDTVVFFNPRTAFDYRDTQDLLDRVPRHSVKVIMPSGYPAVRDRIFPLPADESESQNRIGMCDLVVTRCGYSTVSEAVQAKVPLIVWERPGFVEDGGIVSAIRHLGIGTSLEYKQIRSLDWIAELPEIQQYKQHYEGIDPIYLNNGSEDILTHLQECIA